MPPKSGFDLNDSSNRIIAGIVIALVFLGGWWLIARSVSNPPTDEADTSNVAEIITASGTVEDVTPGAILGPIADYVPIIRGSREAIRIDDQAAGTEVVVAEATLVQIGWIAVRDRDGRTLGAGRFEAGTHQNVQVPLLRATSAGERYQALIYVDDGDKEFDLHKDILVTQEDGSIAGALFSVR